MRSWPDLPALHSTPLTAESVGESDVVVLITAHSAVDYDLVRAQASLIVDTRGVIPIGTPSLVRA